MQPLPIVSEMLVLGGVWNTILVHTLETLFFLSAVLLMVIILLQEGKGGGLASALGGQGAETFGVSSGGVNKVTLFLAGIFLVSALGHALAFNQTITKGIPAKAGPASPFPPLPGDDGTLPGEDGGPPPKEGAGTEPPKKEEAPPAKKEGAKVETPPKTETPARVETPPVKTEPPPK